MPMTLLNSPSITQFLAPPSFTPWSGERVGLPAERRDHREPGGLRQRPAGQLRGVGRGVEGAGGGAD